MARKPTKTQYKARSGAMLWRPSIELVMAMRATDEGFCLACGEVVDAIEPDARKVECPCCGAAKVYGTEELVLMDLTY